MRVGKIFNNFKFIMKKFFFLIFMFCITINVCAQTNYQDVVYLTNGSIIRGIIIEQVPNKAIKIETSDGSVFVFVMEDVEKITKEKIQTQEQVQTNVVNNAQNQSVVVSQQPIKPNLPVLKYSLGGTINPVGGSKSPFLAGFLSFLIPGVGNFYDGDVGAGFFYLGTDILFSSIWMNTDDASLQTVGVICTLVIEICSIVDAASTAKRVNRARGYYLGNNTYLKVSPTIIQNRDVSLLPTKGYSYGMVFNLNF
jgi:hypothetical protein